MTEQSHSPVAHEDGSITLDNASVQRLMDYGLLHRIDDGWYVGRWPKSNDKSVRQSHSPTGDDVELMNYLSIAKYERKKGNVEIANIIERMAAIIATLSPNGVSQPAAEERIARLSLDVGRLLAADPICGGRVSGGTVQAIAALATQPDTGLRGAADKLEAMQAEIERLRNALAQARQVLGAYQPDSAPTFYMEAIWEADEALNLNRERG